MIRQEQCDKVCRILDDVLANRPTERDSLIIAVRKAFESLKQFGNSEQFPSAQPERKTGRWILVKGSNGKDYHKCSECLHTQEITGIKNYCAVCGADMRGEQE